MNNINGKLPINEDAVVIEDVIERFDYHTREIENNAENVGSSSSNANALNQARFHIKELFSIATSCNIPPIVEPLEILVRVFSTLKSENQDLSNLLQATIAILERLQNMVRSAQREGGIDMDSIQVIQKAVTPLAHAKDESSLYGASTEVFNLLVGDFRENMDEGGVELFDEQPFFENKVEIPRRDVDRSHFSFMRILSEAVDARQLHWEGRTEKLLSMAIGMNAFANNIVDVDQLEAAVYLHDFGMLKFNDELLARQKLSAQEYKQISAHPVAAYELALTIPNLGDCAKMVYQHHERVDGKGYPDAITGNSICNGAKILAICDAFFSMTHVTAHKPHRKSILRAIVEINACTGKQFDAFWVDKFNKTVRAQRLGGFL